jgi:hypothetical protein
MSVFSVYRFGFGVFCPDRCSVSATVSARHKTEQPKRPMYLTSDCCSPPFLLFYSPLGEFGPFQPKTRPSYPELVLDPSILSRSFTNHRPSPSDSSFCPSSCSRISAAAPAQPREIQSSRCESEVARRVAVVALCDCGADEQPPARCIGVCVCGSGDTGERSLGTHGAAAVRTRSHRPRRGA